MLECKVIKTELGNLVLGSRNGKYLFCRFAIPSLEAVMFGIRREFPFEEIVMQDISDKTDKKNKTERSIGLEELLCGRGRIFRWEDLQLQGTPLQLRVWHELFKLGPQELVTYSGLAARCGYGKAVRAVATVVGKNPLALVIPCHRVIRKGGAIGNYYWGRELKIRILQWEGII